MTAQANGYTTWVSQPKAVLAAVWSQWSQANTPLQSTHPLDKAGNSVRAQEAISYVAHATKANLYDSH